MSFKDIFKKSSAVGPDVVEVKPQKAKKAPEPNDIIDFSFNEYRFGHYLDNSGFFKSYPVAAGLYGFFKFETERISAEEYNMWKDSLVHPQLYLVTAERLGRGFKRYSISLKKELK